MKKLLFFLTGLWLALLPWHAFLKTWLSKLFLGSHADFLPLSSNIFSLWKEIVLFTLLGLLLWLRRQEIWNFNYRNKLFLTLTAFVTSLIVFGGSQANSVAALILGLRTDLLFVPSLLVGLLLALSFKKSVLDRLLRLTLLSLTIAFGIFLCFWIIKPDIGLYFGYSPYQSSYVEEKPLPVYHCLFINDSCLPRLQASFSGPNQAGSLSLLWAALLFYFSNNVWLLLLPLIAVSLTFSRSALLGGLVAILCNLPKKALLLTTGVISLIVIGIFSVSPDVVTHGLSTSEHWHKTVDGIQRLITAPFGTGLGSAGPVSRRLLGEEHALISENWYLQLGEEAGILTMLLFVLFIGLLSWSLLKSNNQLQKLMGMVLLGTSFQGLFLHLWEDSTLTMLIWFFIGVSLCYNSNESTQHYGK